MAISSNLFLTITGFSQQERITLGSSGTASFEIRETLAADTDEIELEFQAVPSNLDFIYIRSSANLVLRTYDATDTLVQTINLVANAPVIYKKNVLGSNPFSGQFSYIEVDNAALTPTQLVILGLKDATP
jgi:hypothetical protein